MKINSSTIRSLQKPSLIDDLVIEENVQPNEGQTFSCWKLPKP